MFFFLENYSETFLKINWEVIHLPAFIPPTCYYIFLRILITVAVHDSQLTLKHSITYLSIQSNATIAQNTGAAP